MMLANCHSQWTVVCHTPSPWQLITRPVSVRCVAGSSWVNCEIKCWAALTASVDGKKKGMLGVWKKTSQREKCGVCLEPSSSPHSTNASQIVCVCIRSCLLLAMCNRRGTRLQAASLAYITTLHEHCVQYEGILNRVSGTAYLCFLFLFREGTACNLSTSNAYFQFSFTKKRG